MRSFFDDEESFKEAAGYLHFNNPPSDSISLQRVGSGSTKTRSQERNEDICFVIIIPQVMPPQERSESIDILATMTHRGQYFLVASGIRVLRLLGRFDCGSINRPLNAHI